MAGLAMGPMGWDSYWSAPLYNKLVPNFTKRVARRYNPMRHKYKRGGRFKRRISARSRCLSGGQPEKKFLDAAFTTSPSATGTINTLAIIPQGDGESERIGRKAIITNILAHGFLEFTSSTNAQVGNRVRVMVVMDRSTNGLTFSAADLMNIAGTADIDAFRDLSHVGRFDVLYNNLMTMNPSISGDGTTNRVAGTVRNIAFNIKCCVPIEYDASATTGAITTQQVNSLHLLMFETVATPATTVNLTVRVRYVG